MDRRKFLRGLTATAGVVQAATPRETRLVHWNVKGFYCVTCAVGLEVMLKDVAGVTRARALWPSGQVTVGFDDRLITERKLREFVGKCGFSVAA